MKDRSSGSEPFDVGFFKVRPSFKLLHFAISSLESGVLSLAGSQLISAPVMLRFDSKKSSNSHQRSGSCSEFCWEIKAPEPLPFSLSASFPRLSQLGFTFCFILSFLNLSLSPRLESCSFSRRPVFLVPCLFFASYNFIGCKMSMRRQRGQLLFERIQDVPLLRQ